MRRSLLVEPLAHLIVALALIAAYVTLTILGHDAQVLLGILVGQLGALGVSKVADQVTAAAATRPADPPPPTPGGGPSSPPQPPSPKQAV